MRNFLIFSIIFFFLFSFISAEEISQSDFNIEVYNSTIHISSNDYSGNDKDFNFAISNRSIIVLENGTNVTTEEFYVPYTNFSFPFLFVNNITVPLSLVDRYTFCLNNLSQCQLDSASNISQLNLNVQQRDNDKINLQNQINTLNKNISDTQNQKFIFGIGGIFAGMFLIMLFKGEIGKKFKEKTEGFFNKKQQA